MRVHAALIANLAGVAIVCAGLAAAFVMLFKPLPTLTAGGAVVAWCGPGETSVSAVQVRLDPGIVNTGSIPGAQQPSIAQQQALMQVCTGEADNRIRDAVITGVLAAGLGIAIPLFARPRHASRPPAPPPGTPSGAAAGTGMVTPP